MSYYSPYVLDASRQSTRALDPRTTAGGQYHNHLNASATPVVHPYVHAPVVASRSRDASDASYHWNSSTSNAAYGGVLSQFTAPSFPAENAKYSIDTYPAGPASSASANMYGACNPPLPAGSPCNVPSTSASAIHVPGLGTYQPWSMPPMATFIRRPYNSPIHYLPNELLSHIFMLSLDSQLCDASLNTRAMPLVISHVCATWRGVAVDLPRLWHRLALTRCNSNDQHVNLQLAHLYVERSKGTGLAFHYAEMGGAANSKHWIDAVFFSKGPHLPSTGSRCFCALDLVIQYIDQISELQLVIGHSSSRRLSAVPPGHAKALRQLSFRFLEGGQNVQPASSLLRSPMLEVLYWGADLPGICDVPAPMHVPWQRLTVAHLEESPVAHHDFLDMVRTGQLLQDIQVTLSQQIQRSMLPQQPIHQAVLRELTINGDGPLDEVFCRLHFQSLESLSISSDSNPDAATGWPFVDSRVLLQFVARLGRGLDSFELMPGGTMSEQNLIPILSLPQMSTLFDLYAEITHIGDDFFVRLRPGHGTAAVPLLPHLKKLVVGACTTTDGIIARTLRSRHKYSYPLDHAQVHFVRQEEGRHPRDMQEFQRLRAHGRFVQASC
ncbi:hypothetical protein BD626DRAFT_571067 [Schizophyllum amplum]|uniref:Uncharacterized protein n=1 Tax=Schizophyllum amplum TaxID=97359 RepID=A0A550C8B1_9AGAR|nr:hypothetical protein BD626DRAFT_571067 [Auriculariopsis ampla]